MSVPNHLDDDYLPTRLAAAEKGWELALAEGRRWERIAKALKLSYAANFFTVINHDTLASMDDFDLVESDFSRFGEKAIKVELVRRVQDH